MMIAAWCVAVLSFALAGALEMIEAEPERTQRALSIARVVAYLATGAATAAVVRLDTFGPVEQPLIGLLIAVLIVGTTEGAGRLIGQAHRQAVSAKLDPVARVAVWVLTPVLGLGTMLERWLHVVLPAVAPDEEERETTEEQFREVVAAEADISSAEQALIHGVFSMGDTEVREIMVPRVDIVGIESTTPWSEVLDRVRSAEHARLPVYDDTLDNITGVLYAKDLLSHLISGGDRDGNWQGLARRAAIIPTSKHIDAQLREFQASRTHIAIVVDEYGGTAGLVTIEDILEEIVGEIHDEYDNAEPEIRQEGMTRFWVAGRVSVHELAERLGVDFGISDVATVGGLVYELFNRVPNAGESVIRDGYRIVVEAVSRRRVERVYFERVAPARKPVDE